MISKKEITPFLKSSKRDSTLFLNRKKSETIAVTPADCGLPRDKLSLLLFSIIGITLPGKNLFNLGMFLAIAVP